VTVRHPSLQKITVENKCCFCELSGEKNYHKQYLFSTLKIRRNVLENQISILE